MFLNNSSSSKLTLFFTVVLIVLLFWTGFLPAQIDSTAVQSQNNQISGEMNFGKVLLRTVLSLLLVILLLFLFIMGIKWLQNRTQAGYSKLKSMSVQEAITLGPKKQLFLVTVLDRVLLIGSSENNISLILEMTEDEKKKLTGKKSGKQQSFSKIFANQVAKFSGVQKS